MLHRCWEPTCTLTLFMLISSPLSHVVGSRGLVVTTHRCVAWPFPPAPKPDFSAIPTRSKIPLLIQANSRVSTRTESRLPVPSGAGDQALQPRRPHSSREWALSCRRPAKQPFNWTTHHTLNCGWAGPCTKTVFPGEGSVLG